jgi:gas vesicle protein
VFLLIRKVKALFFNDEILEEFMINEKIFNNKHQSFKKIYSDIQTKYNDILQEKKEEYKKEYIKFEKYRLENKKNYIESNTNAYGVALLSLAVTIIVTFLFSIYPQDQFFHFIVFIVYVCLVAGLTFTRSDFPMKSVVIYDIGIKVLNDIERNLSENSKDLLKKEIAVTQSNEVIKKLDNINEKINEVYKKVEELKKFYNIK